VNWSRGGTFSWQLERGSIQGGKNGGNERKAWESGAKNDRAILRLSWVVLREGGSGRKKKKLGGQEEKTRERVSGNYEIEAVKRTGGRSAADQGSVFFLSFRVFIVGLGGSSAQRGNENTS